MAACAESVLQRGFEMREVLLPEDNPTDVYLINGFPGSMESNECAPFDTNIEGGAFDSAATFRRPVRCGRAIV